jgi:hypothetical protein
MAVSSSGQLFSCVSPTVREYVCWLSSPESNPNSPAGDFILDHLQPDRTHLFIKKGTFEEKIKLGHATTRSRIITYREWIREKIDQHLEDHCYLSTKERQENHSKRKKGLRALQNSEDVQIEKAAKEIQKQKVQQSRHIHSNQILRKEQDRRRKEKESLLEEKEERLRLIELKKKRDLKPKLSKRDKALLKRKEEDIRKRKSIVIQQEKDAKAHKRAKRLEERR